MLELILGGRIFEHLLEGLFHAPGLDLRHGKIIHCVEVHGSRGLHRLDDRLEVGNLGTTHFLTVTLSSKLF